MSDKRNIGILGHPDSGASEVFEAIRRHGKTPPAPETHFVLDGLTDWGEYGDTDKPPYDAKKRKRLFGE